MTAETNDETRTREDPADRGSTVVHLEIGGMTCASCTAAVERALAAVRGVAGVSVNLADDSARVVVSGAGFVVPDQSTTRSSDRRRHCRRRHRQE